MPATSTCPRCQKPVSIPTGIDSDAVVRCPLCDAEFPLGEAIPPELIPVLTPKAQDSASPAEGIDEDVITIPLEPGEELVESAESEDDITIEQSSTEELSGEEEELRGEEAEAETYGLADHSGDVAVEEEEEENEAVAIMGSVPKTAPRRRRQKSALATLIEVVTGGLAGCLVAYYALAFFLGPDLKSKGFPIFTFLPGIERLTTPPEKANGAGEKDKKAPADTSAAPKPANGEAPKTSTEAPAQQASVAKPADQPPTATAPANPPIAAPEALELKKEVKFLRPKLGAAEYVGPRTPKSTTSEELSKALAAAAEKADDYETLCRLGETLAFVNGDASDTELVDRIAAVKTAVTMIASHPELFEKLGEAANGRIESNAGQNVGVLLAGTVKNVAKQKQIYGAIVELAGQSKTVSVLSDQDSDLKVDDKVVVLGVIVREPGSNVVGYSGSKSAVVWAALPVKAP